MDKEQGTRDNGQWTMDFDLTSKIPVGFGTIRPGGSLSLTGIYLWIIVNCQLSIVN
jgi:hypothetical protein